MDSNNPNPRNTPHPQRVPNSFPSNPNFTSHPNFPVYMQNTGNSPNPNFSNHPTEITPNNSHPNQNHMQNAGVFSSPNFPHYPDQANPCNFPPYQNSVSHPIFQMQMQNNMGNGPNFPQPPNLTYPNNFQPNQNHAQHPNHPNSTNPQQIPRAANNSILVSAQNVVAPQISETGSNSLSNSMSEQSQTTNPVDLPFTDPRRLQHEIQENNKQIKVYEDMLEDDNYSDSDSSSSSSSSSSSDLLFESTMSMSKKRCRSIESRMRKRLEIIDKIMDLLMDSDVLNEASRLLYLLSPKPKRKRRPRPRPRQRIGKEHRDRDGRD